MKTTKVTTLALAIGAIMGGVIGFSANQWINPHTEEASASSQSSSSNEPLYWVAPMDPNYKRDKPGKSPMGMDLIPVYAEDEATGSQMAGTITIDPAVENNLGVKTANVVIKPLQPNIQAVGYIAFDESTLWQTNVRTSGWVEKLYVNSAGEHVKQGDTLFTFYSPELVKAQEELLNAKRTGRKGLISGAKERLSALGVDKAQIERIYRNGKALQSIEVKALADGVIATLNVREGGYLSPAQTVISAGPLEHVWVDVELFERQAHWITNGSKANMSLDALPGKTWQGTVDYLYPILDPATRTFRVRLKFDNPQGELKPNMFANIELTPQSDREVVTIPRSAVIHSGGMSRVVLALGEGKYRSARIETGREAGEFVEVLEGLTTDDKVVTSAQFMLDSESSQSADLSRINGLDAPAESVWAKGHITDLMTDHHMITLNHQPVPEWNWPGMVMNFKLSPQIDTSSLEKGNAIEFAMEKDQDGQYLITEVKPAEAAPNQVWVNGTITMLMADFGMVTVSHEPVDALQWQSGEQNFSVAEGFDLSPFSEGQSVRFLVENQSGEWQLSELKPQGEQQ